MNKLLDVIPRHGIMFAWLLAAMALPQGCGSVGSQTSAAPPATSGAESNQLKGFFPVGVLTACDRSTMPFIGDNPVKTKDYFDKMCRDISRHGMNTVVNFSSPTDSVKTLLDVADEYNLKVLPSINELMALNVRNGVASGENFLPVSWTALKASPMPSIDGRLDDPCWRVAYKTGPFVNLNACGFPSEATTGYLLYDDDNLYVACDLTAKALKADCAERDGEVYKDDCVEIFLDPSNGGKSYYHFIVNAKGVQYDERRESSASGKVGWNAKWDSAVSRNARGWTVEVAIPFKSLGFAKPKPGELWQMNLARENHSQGELSSWALTNSFHNPERFGTIHFGGQPDTAAPQATQLTGVVKDDNGVALSNIPLVCDRFVAITDADGAFSMSGFTAGEYLLALYAPGFIPTKVMIAKGEKTKSIEVKAGSQVPAGKSPQSVYDIAKKICGQLKSHRSLIGYYTCDEPHGIGWSIDQLAIINKAVESVDPQRCAINTLDKPEHVKSFCMKVNPKVVMHDNYPLKFSPNDNFRTFTKELDLVRSSIPPETPLWLVLQAHGFDRSVAYLREPTPQELRAMTYLAIAHGAKGIIYFLYQTMGEAGGMYGLLDKEGKSTAKWEELGRLAPKLQALAPTLLKLSLCDNTSSGSGNSDVQTLKDINGAKHVMVVNKDVLRGAVVEVETESSAAEPRVIDVLTGGTLSSRKDGGKLRFKVSLEAGEGRLFSVL